jgi:hypothetical protein
MITSASDFPSYKLLKNLMAGFLAAYGIISFFCFIFLERTWTVVAPKAPNVMHGYIYQHNNHGSYTYFSAFQATTCALMFMTSIPLCAIGIAMAPKNNLRFSSSKFGHSWTYESDDPTAIRWKAAFVGALVTPAFLFTLGHHIIESLNSVGIVFNLG